MIKLRTVETGDEEFLLRLYASTRAEELSLVPWTDEQKNGFVRMQYEAQSTHYRNVFPQLKYRIILHEDKPAGRFLTARLHDEIRIVDVSLLPDVRNGGISSALITQVLTEAKQEGKCVRLYVSAGNPARHLYERLGFREIRNDGIHALMEAKPDAVNVLMQT
jgi:ribosomal protein S18 acetylase RimI-like enzyme